MKSNRLLQAVLLVLIIIFAAAAGLLYKSNSSEIQKHDDLVNTLSQKSLTYSKGLSQEDDLKKTGTALAKQLADAQALMAANSNFRSSAETIDYDEELFNVTNAYKLQITNLTSAAPTTVLEKDTTYHVTTFMMTVAGLSPRGLFSSPADDRAYIAQVVSNILALTHSLSANNDFDTAVFPSVNYTVPAPMTDADIQDLIGNITDMVRVQIADQIKALPDKLKADNPGLTQKELDDLITTTTDKLIADTLAAETPDQLAVMVDKVAIERPSAIITIDIWTK
jgi:hypothetical protein